jgi:DNA polymerase-3 subunit epsilon
MNQSTAPAITGFLQLQRPLVFFDLETTGFDLDRDRIVEIYAMKMHPDGRQEEKHHIINPGIAIPKEATKVHGISNDTVIDAPFFAALAGELADFFAHCDVAGFNICNFDMPFLLREFHRCNKNPFTADDIKTVDVCTLFHKRFKRDLTSAFKFYCGKEHADAHSAKADVLATIEVLKHQLLMYTDIEPSPEAVHQHLFPVRKVDIAGKFVLNNNEEICFGFGKHEGQPAASQPDYLKWMLDKDFSEDTKDVVRQVLNIHNLQ